MTMSSVSEVEAAAQQFNGYVRIFIYLYLALFFDVFISRPLGECLVCYVI